MSLSQPDFANDVRKAIEEYLRGEDIMESVFIYAEDKHLSGEQMLALKKLLFFLDRFELYAR